MAAGVIGSFASYSQPKPSKKEAKSANYGNTTAAGIKFNLPPHRWSLPISTDTLRGKTDKFSNGGSDFHGLRRGRLWFYYDFEKVSSINAGINYGLTAAGISAGIDDARAGRTNQQATQIERADTEWGFQFLWNPEAISTSVNINMDVTPSASDRFRSSAGFFPGQETLALSITIDRTNDFACMKRQEFPQDVISYYTAFLPQAGGKNTSDIVNQLYDLHMLGTMADVEYLFKAANSAGPGGKQQWFNLLGRKTADVGFIQPSILAIQLGPESHSLSYVGWLTNLNITHTAFTEDMIPIRTHVDMSIQCLTGMGNAV